MSYEELQRKINQSIFKEEARRKILKQKRDEKQAIKSAGGGVTIAKTIYGKGTDFHFGANSNPVESVDERIEREQSSRCMEKITCFACGNYHGYCTEITEEKEKLKMLPSGDGTQTATKTKKGGLNWVTIDALSTAPKEAKVLMVRYQEDGAWGPRVNLKLAFNGEIAYLGMKPSKKDPRYKILVETFGQDENNWVDQRFFLVAEKDEFSESYNMRVQIPTAKKGK